MSPCLPPSTPNLPCHDQVQPPPPPSHLPFAAAGFVIDARFLSLFFSHLHHRRFRLSDPSPFSDLRSIVVGLSYSVNFTNMFIQQRTHLFSFPATMAATTAVLILCISAVAMNMRLVDSAHHTGAPAPVADCSTVILNMADCLSYITAGSTVKKPEGTCCSGLKTVLKTDAECLCEAFKNSAQLGLSLNNTKALALPSACHINAPSFSYCGIDLGTGAAPVPAPMAVGEAPTRDTSGPSTALAPKPASQNSGSSKLPISTISVFLSMLLSAYFFSY